MSNAFHNSVHALGQAILEELTLAEDNSRHGTIHISCEVKCLSNGIKRCSAQIECGAGCGWLVEADGGQADVLQQKAIAIQSMLHGPVEEAPMSLSEILLAVIPEFLIESQPAMPKRVQEILS